MALSAPLRWQLELLQAKHLKLAGPIGHASLAQLSCCLRGRRGSEGEDFLSRQSDADTVFPSDFCQQFVQVPHFLRRGVLLLPHLRKPLWCLVNDGVFGLRECGL